MIRIEIAYEKGPELRYLSHLELMRVFERAIRRAKIPMEYSQGFNPRPKIVHASALSVGMTSECERAHLRLIENRSSADLGRSLSEKLPKGIVLTSVRELPTSAKPSYDLLDRVEYVVSFWGPPPSHDVIDERIAEFMAQDAIVIKRWKDDRVREVDIRPFVVGLEALDTGDIQMEFFLGPEGRAKPQEVLSALGLYMEEDPLPSVHKTKHFQHRTRRRGAVRRR